MAAPLVKWPGGKRSLAKEIVKVFPSDFSGEYFEPFAGGAAVFFHWLPSRATLADTNPDLINLYRVVRDNPTGFLSTLQSLPNSEADYYRVRSWQPQTSLESAARLYYLMLLSFNGIFRVNLKGQFNVPYGHKTHLRVADEAKIRAASRTLATCELYCQDFEKTSAMARSGDLVYFDPPYTVAHSQNGFLKYNEVIFSYEDQKRLAECARVLAQRGCSVVISNADHDSIESLYPGFNYQRIDRASVIAARSSHRRSVSESLIFLRS